MAKKKCRSCGERRLAKAFGASTALKKLGVSIRTEGHKIHLVRRKAAKAIIHCYGSYITMEWYPRRLRGYKHDHAADLFFNVGAYTSAEHVCRSVISMATENPYTTRKMR
jgi:hypothetical protein